MSLLTDADGRASFPIVTIGTGYVIEVEMSGYGALRATDIEVHAERIARFELRLAGALQETVEARAVPVTVDIAAVGTATRFSDEFIEDLPAPGRFYQDMLHLVPGISDRDRDGNTTR